MTTEIDPERDVGLQGHYAGVVTRVSAFVIDVVVSVGLFLLFLLLFRVGWEYITNHTITWGDHRIITIAWFALWAIVYFAHPWATSGRSLGMAIVGLRVVRADGTPVSFGRAVVRIVTLPLSLIFLGIGFLIMLVQPERRALHDLIAGTAVVYSWDARAARLRFLANAPTDR
ncbi:MAG TPA: RDD family protein [Acidimicrobiales bacterium]|jgi:uncharacterized RDD family membrane protein YckC